MLTRNKRFMYFSISVLCLSISALIGFHIGSRSAVAQVETSNLYALGHNGWIIDTLGQVWNINYANCWQREPDYDPPVPLDEIKWWDNHAVITVDDVAWRHDTSTGQWRNCGPWPGGAVPANQGTWGGVKGKYDGKK